MFFTLRLCFNLTILALAALWAFAAYAPSVNARPRGELVLATSAEDAALRARLLTLSPSVNPEEARRVAYIAYTTGQELARKWRMIPSPTVHSFLINIGVKKAGYCFQFATELLLRLDAEKLQTLELHWAESDAGTDTEHNVIAVTARGQLFAQGIMLDNWRHSGRLLWGPLNGDPDHVWQENKDALARRINRRASTADRPKRETNPKSKPQPRLKTPARGDPSAALRSLPSFGGPVMAINPPLAFEPGDLVDRAAYRFCCNNVGAVSPPFDTATIGKRWDRPLRGRCLERGFAAIR